MNLRDLSYLVALADHQHFGKAARACFVSQPALSMQINKLEKHLGVRLIERNRKSVLLTQVGIVMAERARSILHEVGAMREFAKNTKDPFSGELTLGVFPSLGPYLLPSIIPEITAQLNQLKLYLVEEQTAHLLDKLSRGKLDAAILALPINDKALVAQLLFDEEFLLAVHKTHPFAKRKQIKQTDLKDKNLLLLSEGHCLRDQALSLCNTVNAKESEGFSATSLETLRHLVASGLGMTLIPKLAFLPHPDIVYIPFSKPKPLRTLALVWRRSSAKTVLFERLAALIGKCYV